MEYALNRDKTESAVFEDAFGCTVECAYQDMLETKQRFHKMDGVQGYHLIQSFAAGEVTPELAHLIGQEFAAELLKGQFEVVVTTHLNTSHYHNHIVWNSVSMADGHKYHSNGKSYYNEVRRISDSLCRKYGLSIIQPGQGKARHYAEWKAEQEGKPTWRTAIHLDIREAVQKSFTWKQFLEEMEGRGYQWKLNRKYIALKAPGMERFIRLRSLGERYSEEGIREWILKPKTKEPVGKKQEKPKQKLTGLQALYYSYLYQMGALKQKPRRAPYVVRQDIRRLDERIAQMDFLQRHGITSREKLLDYRREREGQVTALVKERHRLYGVEPKPERIEKITAELKPLRKEIRMCVKIEKHSEEIEKKMEELKEQEYRRAGNAGREKRDRETEMEERW